MMNAKRVRALPPIRDGIVAWLAGEKIPHSAPEPLPSLLYADASHPLTAGYELLARRTFAIPVFRQGIGYR